MKKDWWLLLITVSGWAALMAILPVLPDSIPMHWNISGEIDRWGSKYSLIWLGALAPAVWCLMTVLPKIDPKGKDYTRYEKTFRVIRAAVTLLLFAVSWMTVAAALNVQLNIVLWVKILMGLLFLVLGNLMPRIKPGWFVGIRTPWTLSDPVVWQKTHRVGGFMFAAAGVAFLISAAAFSGPAGFWIPMILLIGGAVFDIVYSAVLWKNRSKGQAGKNHH